MTNLCIKLTQIWMTNCSRIWMTNLSNLYQKIVFLFTRKGGEICI